MEIYIFSTQSSQNYVWLPLDPLKLEKSTNITFCDDEEAKIRHHSHRIQVEMKKSRWKREKGKKGLKTQKLAYFEP